MSADGNVVGDTADDERPEDPPETAVELDSRIQRLEQGFDVLRSKLKKVKAERDELRETVAEQSAAIESLKGELADLRGRVDPDPRTTAYDNLSRAERVRQLRLELLERAENAGLTGYRMTYDDVQSHVFNENGSPGYMYQLMRLAAGLEAREADARGSSFPGYYFGTNEDGDYVIRVVVDEVEDDGLIHAVNGDSGSDDSVHTVNDEEPRREG